MKFSEDRETGLYRLEAYGDDWVQVNDERIKTAFILSSSALITTKLPEKFGQLQEHHLGKLFQQNTEIVIIGTGVTQRLPTPEIFQALINSNTGFEFMTTAAACRTYKILNAEGRSVSALLFPT